MTATGAACAAAALLFIPQPPPPETPPAAVVAPTLAQALAPALDGDPIVLGVGELHQTTATAGISSSLARFTREAWPLIAARASDLIVETWVTDGACGRAETATVEKVEKATERPPATENEIVTLVERAKAAGVRPHALSVSCDDYRLLAPRGQSALDFERMLALIQRKLDARLREVLAARPPRDAGKLVVVYGGALHNDLYPDALLARFSYGVPAFRATLGRYRELDLYVPEYLERTPAMQKEAWYGAWKRAAAAEDAKAKYVVIRRSAASYAIVFPSAAK